MPENQEQKNPPMNRDELIRFLRDNLSICAETEQFTGVTRIMLVLDGQVISTDVF